MATTLTVNSNYSGSAAGEIIGAAFKEADTIANNLVTVLPDVDFKVSLRKISYANGRTDFACGFTPSGAVTLSEKEIVPKKLKNEQEICKEDLRQIWSSATMGFSAHNDNMPADVEAALLNEILGDHAQAVDFDIWNGSDATDGSFTGFTTLFAADANVVKPTSVGAAPSKANVIAEIEKVLSAVPVSLRRKSDLVVGVSPDVALAYEQALVAAGIANGLGGDSKELRYGSQVLSVINGLADGTIVAYQRKNLYFGTGLLADHQEIRIKDMDDTDFTGTVRFKMVYTAGVAYVNSEEIVYYTFQ